MQGVQTGPAVTFYMMDFLRYVSSWQQLLRHTHVSVCEDCSRGQCLCDPLAAQLGLLAWDSSTPVHLFSQHLPTLLSQKLLLTRAREKTPEAGRPFLRSRSEHPWLSAGVAQSEGEVRAQGQVWPTVLRSWQGLHPLLHEEATCMKKRHRLWRRSLRQAVTG